MDTQVMDSPMVLKHESRSNFINHFVVLQCIGLSSYVGKY